MFTFCFAEKMANSIYISNASSHNVYVRVLCDISYRKATSIGVGATAGTFGGIGIHANKEKKWSLADKVGYTIMNRYSSMEFHQDSSKEVCYVTIKVKTDEEKYLCENHPLRLKCGLIIDGSCYIHSTKKGLYWTDIDGICHQPDLKNKKNLPKDLECSLLLN